MERSTRSTLMREPGEPPESWARLRYERLLPAAARSRAAGRVYARLVGAVEFMRDARRRHVGVERIARWRRVSRAAASRVFYGSLVSEAQEEADSIRFMRDPTALGRWFPDAAEMPPLDGPVVFATLHLGSPVLGYLFLRRAYALDVQALVRGLDDDNPMAGAKRRWGQLKVAWLRQAAGGGILGADASSATHAREHLLEGRAIFTALDVPGDVGSRTAMVEICGEALEFSSGAVTVARLAGSTILPVVAISGPERMRLHFGNPVEPAHEEAPFAAVFRELVTFVERFPDEWWLWAYVQRVSGRVDDRRNPG